MTTEIDADARKAVSELLFIIALLVLLTAGVVMTLFGSAYIATPFPFALCLFAAFTLLYRKQRVLTAWNAAIIALKG
ncbi:TPA: hypothetical protein ACSP3W_002892 [Aeromonas veronii]|uniref:hypothetical protein n=1 Tax=Aeromonas TaxID=642 RepID=UPI0022E0E96C|nr:hypothetical protein [Aeromonas sp. Y293-4]